MGENSPAEPPRFEESLPMLQCAARKGSREVPTTRKPCDKGIGSRIFVRASAGEAVMSTAAIGAANHRSERMCVLPSGILSGHSAEDRGPEAHGMDVPIGSRSEGVTVSMRFSRGPMPRGGYRPR